MAKRRVKLFIIVAILAVAMVAVCVILLGKGPPLPAVDEISEMKATYYGVEEDKEIQFQVPDKHWEKIFDALLPAQWDFSTAAWVVLGQLDITLKNGRPFGFYCFGRHKVPVHSPAARPSKDEYIIVEVILRN